MRGEGRLKFVGAVKRSGDVSELEILPDFCEGLYRLGDFSHIIVFFWLHLRDSETHRNTVRVVPKRHPGSPEVGVFASRSPSRPNPIGFSVVELAKIEGCRVFVEGLDALDGSPIIDIKPYIPRADSVPEARAPKWTLCGPPT